MEGRRCRAVREQDTAMVVGYYRLLVGGDGAHASDGQLV